MEFPKCIRNEKVTISPEKNNDKCFQYAATIPLNYQIIKKNQERISSMNPFINQYNWKK